jgi:CRISPR-associated endonuclease Csn1
MAKKYLMGLDLGTDSVGWCVTDENNQIVRKGGKSLWGVRLFEEASDCKARRLSREARRRNSRKVERIDLLQSIFAPEMDKVDPKFFLRMNNSSILEEDKDESIKGCDGTLFAGVGGIDDKSFYHRFPTIYHLRNYLLTTNEKADIRYIYLAFHHMVKYRGNFLHYGEAINTKKDDQVFDNFAQINNALSALGQEAIEWNEAKINQFVKLAMGTRGISDAKKAFADFFGSDSLFLKGILIPLLAGGKVSVSKIYDLEDDEEPDPSDICVRSATFDEDFEKLATTYAARPETKIIEACKSISDFVLLKRLLGSSSTLSEAMVSRYLIHRQDLKALKDYVRKHAKEKYGLVFNQYDPKLCNYVRYVGMNDTRGKRSRYEHCSREEFYAFLKKEIFGIVKNVPVSDPFVIDVLNRMETGDYLPRQNSTDNGVFPYQLNLAEMQAIIAKQSAFYPFFATKDRDGYSNQEKIESILTYHIPYYVGPLMAPKAGDQRSSFAWVVRTQKKITPWNFAKGGIIDFDQSAENFIQRMLNKCTYLPDCYCLPKSSLLYSRYEVISFLNNIVINGKAIPAHSVSEGDVSKDELMLNVFSKGSVTKAGLLSYLKKKFGSFDAGSLTFRSGKPVDQIDASLKSYADFSLILGRDYVETHLDQIESMIRDLSIFTDKDIIDRRLHKNYGLTDEQAIRRIKSLSYSGFGRLSKDLLCLKSSWVDKATGEIKDITLLDAMYETGENLMEIIADSGFNFGEQIHERQAAYAPELDPNAPKLEQVKKAVDDLYVSPSLKRPLIQAYEIVDEVGKILGRPVDEYYVECTRGEDPKEKGKKKPSRLENLLRLYGEAKATSQKLLNELNHKAELSATDSELKQQIVGNQHYLDECYASLKDFQAKDQSLKFRSDKLFFYYIQLGRCMYSLKPLDLNALYADSQEYDIDHIIPQSLTKDDSLENRVLVYQDYNRAKKDVYPLPSGFLAPGARSFYLYLHKLGLIGDRKLGALMRPASSPLKDDELATFTNRQLVSTNQAVIGLINILQKFEKVNGKAPEVVYSKAGLVSDFRQKFDFIKSRDANDFHHAHDAYLNIIVGRANHEYFRYMNGRGWFDQMHRNSQTTNPDKIFDEPSQKAIDHGYVLHPILDAQKNVCWNYSESLKQIEKDIYHRFDVMVTVRQFVQPGLFGKVTIHKKSEYSNGNLFPVKKGLDPAKYGGYLALVYGHFSLLSAIDKKGKQFVTLLPIPTIYANGDNPSQILTYANEVVGLKAERVLIPCLRVNTVVKKGSVLLALAGKNSNNDSICKNLSQMRFSKEELRLIKATSKLVGLLKEKAKVGLDPAKSDFDDKVCEMFGASRDGSSFVVSPAANAERNKEVVITKNDLLLLYEVIEKKLTSAMFANVGGPTGVGNLLAKPETLAVFKTLSIAKEAIVISELLKETSANSAENGDLSLIGGPTKVGKRHLNNVLTSGTEIIAQSPTGYYDKVLWKVK